MIIFLYNFLAFINAVYFLGNAYCAWKIYRLKHRWGIYVSIAFFVDALAGLASVVTLGFGPRPAQIVWWSIILALVTRLVAAVGVAVTTLFFMGILNGVGSYAKTETNTDKS
jgi:hypothetical protein